MQDAIVAPAGYALEADVFNRPDAAHTADAARLRRLVPYWLYNDSMRTVTLSVKQVPADLARRLKARAARNHRSLQGELLAILTEAGRVTEVGGLARLVRELDLSGPSESARLVREDRDGRRR